MYEAFALQNTLFLETDESSGEEPGFLSAMSRYYDDTVACMGALQIVPVFAQSQVFLLDSPADSLLNLGSFVHSIITKKGRALNVLFERLHRAADSQDGWKEDGVLKSVSQHLL